MAAESPTRLEIEAVGRRLRLSGDVDIHTAPRLADRIAQLATDDDVVVDLEGVEFIDSSGLRVLIEAHQQLLAAGSRLVMCSPSQVASSLFEMTGLQAQFHIE